jgi:hypothetical protein
MCDPVKRTSGNSKNVTDLQVILYYKTITIQICEEERHG